MNCSSDEQGKDHSKTNKFKVERRQRIEFSGVKNKRKVFKRIIFEAEGNIKTKESRNEI